MRRRRSRATIVAKARIVGMSDQKVKNLYPITELATSTELTKKLSFIKEANAAAKAYDSKIVRVNDRVQRRGEARRLRQFGRRLLGRFAAAVHVQRVLHRRDWQDAARRATQAAAGVSGWSISTRRKAADIGKEAARIAIVNLSAWKPRPGRRPSCLGRRKVRCCCTRRSGTGSRRTSIIRSCRITRAASGRRSRRTSARLLTKGLFANMRGTINVDDEGNAPQSTTLIENGILRGYMNDRISAKQLGVKPSGNGRRQAYNHPPMPRMTNTYLRAGQVFGRRDPEIREGRRLRQGLHRRAGRYHEGRFHVLVLGVLQDRGRQDHRSAQGRDAGRQRAGRYDEGDDGRQRSEIHRRRLDLRQERPDGAGRDGYFDGQGFGDHGRRHEGQGRRARLKGEEVLNVDEGL